MIRNPYKEATYRVLVQEDATYAVEVKVPEAFPAVIRSFATASDAESWISEHKRKAENGGGASRGRWSKNSGVRTP